VPGAPDASRNWAQSWSYSNERDVFGTLRGEMDVGRSSTLWAAYGARHSHEANSLANVTVVDSASDATTYRFDNRRQDHVSTGEIGLRARASGGGATHEFVLSLASFTLEKKNAYGMSSTAAANLLHTNLNVPVDSAMPALTVFGNDLTDPKLTGRIRLDSLAAADTLGLFDDRLALSIGGREQRLDIRSFAYNTGIQATPYVRHRLSPVIAGVFKIDARISAYANYIESLAQGESAPSSATNFGAQLAPYVAKQREIGLKFDSDEFGGGMAFFSTSKPRAFVDSVGYFSQAGADRHQGLEMSMFGEPIANLRTLLGVTFLDARQRRTGVAATEGKRVIGVPSEQGSLGLDWDVPGAPGWSVNSRVVLTGAEQANATNTLAVPGWTRVDIGAKYTARLYGRQLVLRGRIDNIANTNYWASAGGYPNLGYLVLATPRTFTFSCAIDL
jgi:iron complex outermembrane recepter protein